MTYVEGVDVSKWQGLMDWQKCYNAGARFAFIRAGSISNIGGVCYEDSEFKRNADLAPPIMPVGFYWYMRPNHDSYKQADYFWNLIKDEDDKLPPVIDIEDPGGMPTYYIVKRLNQFVERLQELSGRVPIVYTSPGFANASLIGYDWSKTPLWVAHWTLYIQPTLPYGATSWLFWQFEGDGNMLGDFYGAQSYSIDRNRFNGNTEQFNLYLGGEVPEPEEPPHEVFLPYVAQVTAERGLFTHSEPNALPSTRTGSLAHRTEVDVVNENGVWKLCEAVYWAHGDFLKRI